MVQETNPRSDASPPDADRWAPQAWIHRPEQPLAGAAQGALAGLRFALTRKAWLGR